MGRIKISIVMIAVLYTAVFLNSCDNNLLQAVEEKVAGATGITVDLRYTGAFEISESMPVIFRFYPNPFSGDPETDGKIKDIKFTKQDTCLIQDSELTGNESGKYFVLIFHDLDNSGVEDGIEDDALYENNGDTNITYDMDEENIIEQVDSPFYLNIADKMLMAIGSKYSINFADEHDYVDEWETDDNYLSTSCDTITLGTTRGHWLGWEDTDFIKLSPSADGNYTVTINEFNSNNPIMDISIMVNQGGTLLHVDSHYDVTAFPSSLSADFTVSGGDQYYLRVKNPTSRDHGVGNYTVNFTGPN